MSIIYNGQTVAGVYAEQILNNADTINAGIIKIATQEEVDAGENNTSAVTPLYLSSKQDKLESGDNISIENDIISCDIKPDVSTIIQNEDGTLTNVGQLTKSGTIKIDWEGTEAEYTRAMLNGEIDPDWYCYITDDESIVDYEGSTKLDFNQITNCLLEVPQRIKLELADGVLTLKAGSEVIVPNGSGVFDAIITTDDISLSYTKTNTVQEMIVVTASGNSLQHWTAPRDCFSGSTAPTQTYALWYDTSNNIIKSTTDGGSTWGGNLSLPIGIISVGSSGIISIDQVFNGMGYIGSTVWVDKGVKGLIPNGKNEDGTLRNIEVVTNKVVTLTNASNLTIPLFYIVIPNGDIANSATDYWVYDEQENCYVGPEKQKAYFTVIAQSDATNGIISNFQPKLPFRAVDYNDIYTKNDVYTKTEADNRYVNVTGDIMTGNLIINKEQGSVAIKSISLDTTTIPSETQISAFRLIDKNNKILGDVRFERYTSGTQASRLLARSSLSGSEVNGSIAVAINKDGLVFTEAPTPATGDNSTKIATTAFVNTLIPAGTVILSADADTPAGYLYCNGSAVSRTTYAKLFTAIGTTYGAGNGSTTFNLPNYSTYKFVTSGTVSVKGNGKTIGLTDGTNNAGLVARNTQNAMIMTGVFNTAYGTSASGSQLATNTSFGVTTDASKSGITGSIGTGTIKMYIKY